MQIIKDQTIIEDSWQYLELEYDADASASSVPEGDVIVPLSYWTKCRSQLLNRKSSLGILIDSGDDIEAVTDDLQHFKLIALNFPVFTDGRPYSYARLLRERYHFKGEIRAVGDIMRDQLYFMQRCGFNAFQLRADKDIKDALNAFGELTIKYQTASDHAKPVYKYR